MFVLFTLLALASISASGLSLRFGGRFIPVGRIIGGEDANITDYPYQLCMIDEDFGPFCGASLISKKWALTAAHCTDGIEPANITIRAGSTMSRSGGQVVGVAKIYQHKKFSYVTAENDISLLKLSEEVTIETSKTIELSTRTPQVNELATVTGWGIVDPDDDYSDPEILQMVQIPIVDEAVCKEAYKKEGVSDTMICAGLFEEGGKDACFGDSGGPLVVDGVLAGIVSWGIGCAAPGKPGVYTNVASFVDWIEDIKSSDKISSL